MSASQDPGRMYERRFGPDIEFRRGLWKALCSGFFQRYVPEDAVVLEVAAGYCEFINSIKAGEKIALDINPDVRKYAGDGVRAIVSGSTDVYPLADSSCDIVFVSNFFEHLTKEDIVRTLRQIHRVLKGGGRILILQPNIRFCYRDYWNFFDHISPLDDKSMSEALEVNGFKVLECKEAFLPFSTKSGFPRSISLVKLYLKIPALHRIFGKQMFICASRQ